MEQIMKRYMVFIFRDYYPRGGADDYKGSINNIDELISIIKNVVEQSEYIYEDLELNLFDTQTMTVIMRDEDTSFYISDRDGIDQKELRLIEEILKCNE